VIALILALLAPQKTIPDRTMFYYICLQEGHGRVQFNAFRKKENAIGPAQITPDYLSDANEWLMSHGHRRYMHAEMYDYRKSYLVCRAYWERYNLVTLEERARAHCGGPDGPCQACTLDYWKQLQSYLPESRRK